MYFFIYRPSALDIFLGFGMIRFVCLEMHFSSMYIIFFRWGSCVRMTYETTMFKLVK